MVQVLADYGYHVHPNGTFQEQQFSCDLHGTGRDTKPSARLYPGSNDFYCFACDKTRDAVELVRVKENLGFMEALDFLERKYNLPVLPWEDDDAYNGPQQSKPEAEVGARLATGRTYADDSKQIRSALISLTEDRLLPMKTLLPYWEAVDKLSFQFKEGLVAEVVARKAVLQLYDRLMAAMREGVK